MSSCSSTGRDFWQEQTCQLITSTVNPLKLTPFIFNVFAKAEKLTSININDFGTKLLQQITVMTKGLLFLFSPSTVAATTSLLAAGNTGSTVFRWVELPAVCRQECRDTR